MSSLPQVVLRPHKSGTFVIRHPWVLAKSLAQPDLPLADGEVVDLVSATGHWVARGIYNGRSHIRVRLYTWRADESLDDDFWRRRLEESIALRSQAGYDDPLGACRLVFSEADGLSGLIVDRYARHLVVQVAAQAIAARCEPLVRILAELARPEGILLRTDPKIATAEGMDVREGLVWGQPWQEPLRILEHGLAYEVPLGSGQKTGYYLDQRENRRAAAAWFRGRRVLDMFCYLGGFSLAAAALGGASEVLGFDSSQKAVEQARHHARENHLSQVHFESGEAFATLEGLQARGEHFGAVILDPPRFAGSRAGIDQALRAYHRLNRLGMQLLEPGGILVTCSCSGRVSREQFRQMLFGAAQKAGRDLQLLEQRGAAPDHPVRLSCPETDYLKCFIARVL